MHRSGGLLPTTEYPYLYYCRGRARIFVGDGPVFRSGDAANTRTAGASESITHRAGYNGYRAATLLTV